MSGATLNMHGWTTVLATDAPNPIIAQRATLDGGTARLYANGKVDAVNGKLYSLSPGFDSYADLNDWIENGEIEYGNFQAEAARTVGAIWLDDGTLAGWQLTLMPRTTGLDANGDALTEDELAYAETQAATWLQDQDEIIDHD
jgi:hypothetical protein